MLAQATAAIEPGDTPESIEAKVTALEPELFVRTLRAIALGDLPLDAQGPAPKRRFGFLAGQVQTPDDLDSRSDKGNARLFDGSS